MYINRVKIWLHVVKECQGCKHFVAGDDLEDECLRETRRDTISSWLCGTVSYEETKKFEQAWL